MQNNIEIKATLNQNQNIPAVLNQVQAMNADVIERGATGNGIVNIIKTAESGLIDTYTIYYTNGTTSTFTVTNGRNGTDGEDGKDGENGRGIVSITKTGTAGLVDTYTILYTDNTTSTFTVTNGAGGGGVFIAVYGTTSVSDIQNAYSSQKSIFCEYTISGETQDDYDIILLPLTSYIERVDPIEGTTSSYHFTGYNDGITYTTYIDNTDVWGEVEQIANNYANDDLSNVSSISSSSAVYTEINNRANRNLSNLTSTGNAKFQAPLVSGINIKTINNNSILGSGDIPIQPVPDIDAKSITTNSSDELQTVGVIDQNATTTAIKTWTGTKAEYDALNQTYYAYVNVADEDDILYTTVQPLVDDISLYSYADGTITLVGTIDGVNYSRSSATAIYDENNAIVYREDSTKDIATLIDTNTLYNVEDTTSPIVDILNTLYPIGAIYIGTMATCPLSVLGVGTWQLVAQDRVLQGAGTRGTVGTTINESLPNIKGEGWNIGGASNNDWSGVFSSNISSRWDFNSGQANGAGKLYFNASNSSSTYQDNAPVQQDGYLVNIWERIS